MCHPRLGVHSLRFQARDVRVPPFDVQLKQLKQIAPDANERVLIQLLSVGMPLALHPSPPHPVLNYHRV